jgi:hypothetical protein
MITNQESRHGLVWNTQFLCWDWPVDEETPEELAAAAADRARREAESMEAERRWEIERRREIEKEEEWSRKSKERVAAERKRKADLQRMKQETAAEKLKAAKLEVELKERALEKGAPPAAISAEAVGADLAARAFDIENPPPRPVPLLSLGEHVICTAGNISNVQAPAKAGKSAVIGAIIAAIFDGNRQGSDTLGFSAENPDGKALIHFDTEQSRHDHHALVVKSLTRARLDVPPPWFMSYSVADMSIPERLAALEATIQRAAADHGGVFAVIVDGIADLVFDPNDSAECFALVGHFHALAIKHEAAILTVLHENPGAVEGKTRGHLGSQLERKAETNLRLAKDSNGITTIFAERARHAYIPKDAGSCFQWSHAAGMHVSCGDAGEIKRTANRAKMEAEVAKVFLAGESMAHGRLVAAIMAALVLKDRAAKLRVQTWTEERIIAKGAGGKYRLAE